VRCLIFIVWSQWGWWPDVSMGVRELALRKCNVWLAGMLLTVVQPVQISPTCLQRRPQNVLERSKGLCRLNQTPQTGINSHISGRPSDQSTQHGHLSQLDSCYHCRKKTPTTMSSADYVWNFLFLVLVPYREFISPVMTFILIVLWC
jgi:hypothetical protein